MMKGRYRFPGAVRAPKPEGGYVLVPVSVLLAVWLGYRRGELEFLDVRAWLATFEVVARRGRIRGGRVVRFERTELAVLLKGSDRAVNRSLERLAATGFLCWSERAISWPRTVGLQDVDLQKMLRLTVNVRRRLPVPRHLLCELLRESRPARLATSLGHLLRCLYIRERQCESGGACKASWVAKLFGVSERSVQRERKRLIKLGLLQKLDASQRQLNSSGLRVIVNLTWRPAGKPRRQLSPPTPAVGAGMSPPMKTGISLQRSDNTNPGKPASGVRTRTGRGPRLSRVFVTDLRDPARLLLLQREACREGLVGSSESERLKVFAAAQHALTYGRRNPAGLFATIVRQGLWGHLTLRDEDAARRTLRLAWGPMGTNQSRSQREVPRHEIEDATTVRCRIAASLASVGGR